MFTGVSETAKSSMRFILGGKKHGRRVATIQLVMTIALVFCCLLIGGAMGDASHAHKLRHKDEYTKSNNRNGEIAGAGADEKQLVVAHRALEEGMITMNPTAAITAAPTSIFPAISDPGEPM